MTLKMTSVENGKKCGRVHGTLRAWVQGRERSVCSPARGAALTRWKIGGSLNL